MMALTMAVAEDCAYAADYENFFKLAMLDIYESVKESNEDVRGVLKSFLTRLNVKNFEARIVQKLNTPSRFLWKLYGKDRKTLRWKCTVRIHSKGKSTTTFDSPGLLDKDAGNYFFRRFGPDRFIHATVCGDFSDKSVESRDDFYRNGIVFGGRQYKFVSGKYEGSTKESKKGDESKQSSKNGAGWSCSFTAQLFAVRTITGSSFLEEISIEEVRASLADFTALLSNPSKLNARLSLGFSSTVRCAIEINPANISVIPDIMRKEGDREFTLTDGCGFIHSGLADCVPLAVSSGKPSADGFHNFSLRSKMTPVQPRAIMIQVRVVCGLGLFKGCLLVTCDESLCAPNSIVFRDSMKKAEGSACFASVNSKVYLDVCSTFESPHCSTNPSAHLNEMLIQILSCLKVPDEMFFAYQEEAFSKLYSVLTDREDALRLVQQFRVKSLIPDSVYSADEGEDGEDGLNNADDDDQASQQARYLPKVDAKGRKHSSFSVPVGKRESLLANSAYDMLVIDYPLDEPHLRMKLRKLLEMSMKRLKRCNYRMENSIYLVGAPDPYEVLEPGEVFVSLPYTSKSIQYKFDEGDVLVTRNPMTNAGDVRKLTAVRNDMLKRLIDGSSGGVILFSVKGPRSAADMMSGGDFDGDMYLVLLAANPLVAYTEPSPPFLDPPVAKPAAVVRDLGWDIGWDIFQALCRESESGALGIVSHYLRASFAMHGPLHQKSLHISKCTRAITDAAKTGVTIDMPERPKEYPKFMGGENSMSSIIDKLYEVFLRQSKKAMPSLPSDSDRQSKRLPGLPLDADLLVDNPMEFKEWDALRSEYNRRLRDLKSEPSKSELILQVQQEYREKFNDFCQNDQEKAWALASYIYRSTYESARQREDGTYPLSFCWEVCGFILNDLKFINGRRS